MTSDEIDKKLDEVLPELQTLSRAWAYPVWVLREDLKSYMQNQYIPPCDIVESPEEITPPRVIVPKIEFGGTCKFSRKHSGKTEAQRKKAIAKRRKRNKNKKTHRR